MNKKYRLKTNGIIQNPIDKKKYGITIISPFSHNNRSDALFDSGKYEYRIEKKDKNIGIAVVERKSKSVKVILDENSFRGLGGAIGSPSSAHSFEQIFKDIEFETVPVYITVNDAIEYEMPNIW